ncbi:centriole, cilia and spindle-associated protein [Hippocampus comes]|uniref:Centriole, cilia and spindle-associated protein b n=1 Tax=Hippocampus comes TaxID=109280 RepID=A0A3Q2Y0I0_HIPCM|nr:PREDICTED: centriole, cilia and spindle-associated protein [Hippocampus comes]XP_019751436.1 PREDICTED: centriole, cilia and spindle-associated protein [Hippocampus comes]XP_019751437.1 PREDICTED: centriole, cilia and spindle-associated protein [Hippocampus comes]
MVTKRIRSEYMKKFKDPKWETYSKCYEERLKYRLARRLLEQSHNPWFWSGSDSDSDSVGGNSPQADRSQAQRCEKGDEPAGAELEECQGAKVDVLSLPVLEQEEQNYHSQGAEQSVSKHKSVTQREPQAVFHPEKDPAARAAQQTTPQRLPKFKCVQRVKKTAVVRPPNDDSKHPFALYASGEKDADVAGRKTHNVRPACSTNEIHASALRAKSRREVERQVQAQRCERRRAKSADLDQARKRVQPEFNPWLTEYMRCFSARSR